MAYAPEFTPELSAGYLSNLLNPIDENEQAQVGKARAAGNAGGLGEQASTGAEVGAIEYGAQRNRDDSISKFNLDVASRLIRDFPEFDRASGDEMRAEPKQIWTDIPGQPRGGP